MFFEVHGNISASMTSIIDFCGGEIYLSFQINHNENPHNSWVAFVLCNTGIACATAIDKAVIAYK